MAAGVPSRQRRGATESSIWSILYDIRRRRSWRQRCLTVGRWPISVFNVLDRHLRVLPPCLPGEQYIGGIGVARLLPQSVADRREIHPTIRSWGRLYRTGDAGRYLPDGNLGVPRPLWIFR